MYSNVNNIGQLYSHLATCTLMLIIKINYSHMYPYVNNIG